MSENDARSSDWNAMIDRLILLRIVVVGTLFLVESGCSDSKPVVKPARSSTSLPQVRKVPQLDDDLSEDPGIRLTAQPDALPFVYRNDQESNHFSILESLGGGVGIIDFDVDGQPDVFLPGGGRFLANRKIAGFDSSLHRNVRGQFIRCDSVAGVSNSRFFSHGAAVADFDNDGFPDVLVTGFGGLTLFHNQGDGSFDEQAAATTGLADDRWSSSAGWGDFNGDGSLDLYVTHYTDWSLKNDPACNAGPKLKEICSPSVFEALPDVVYFSNFDGSFRDATVDAEIRNDGKGLGVVIGDFENDGDVDVYVANDTVENFLYRNDGTGRFRDFSTNSGTGHSAAALPEGSMGVDLCDYNNDGEPDLWVANYERENFGLYRNLGYGDCLFRHVSQETGVTAIGGLYVGWGSVFVDLENDGDQDGFVANGHVVRHPDVAPLRQQPLVLLNQDAGKRLVNITEKTGDYGRERHMGRGVAAVDYDADMDIDLVVSHINDSATLLTNESTSGNGIRFRLVGCQSNRRAIGARVTLTCNETQQYRQIIGGGSYASTHEATVHFGVGQASIVESVRIIWPDSSVQDLSNLKPGSEYIVVQGRRSLRMPR